MACAQCGAVIPDGFKYCATCSAAMARQTVTGIGDDTHRLLAEANLLRIRKRLDEAIAICTRVLRIDPANATAHALMGDIHRDEGDYREALGWFKLAVQLNPGNVADRKKLDEMIDRVFPGGKQPAQPSDGETVTAIETPDAPPTPKIPLGQALRDLLYKITPTQVIIASTVLAVIVMITILLVFKDSPAPPKKPKETPATVAPVTPNPPAIVNTDQTEIPPERLIIPAENPGMSSKIPAATPPMPTPTPVQTPTTKDNNTTPATIPPFNPRETTRMNAEQLDQMMAKIRAAMDERLKTLKLQTALRDLRLNPATNVLTIEYEVPLLKGPAQTKEGLLYAGFELIWVADDLPENNIVRFSLFGYGHLAPGQPAKLVLSADVSPLQATDARNAPDYATVAKDMSNVWWHDDIAGADL